MAFFSAFYDFPKVVLTHFSHTVLPESVFYLNHEEHGKIWGDNNKGKKC